MNTNSATSLATMPLRRILAAYATETKFECLRIWRSPKFSIPTLFLPVAFYLLLGVAMAGARAQGHGPSDAFIFVSFVIYGTLAPGLLGIASSLSSDRAQRIVEFKRALPAPFACFVVSKVSSAVVLSIAVTTLIVVLAATVGGVSLSIGQFAVVGALAVVGSLPVSAVGICVATWSSPSGASAIGGSLLVAMAILAGLFYPLPGALNALRPIWPTYHVQQLSLAAIGEPIGGNPHVSIFALIGFAVVFGTLAARRIARSG
jgi:ABC-2 type transport system permease protein